LYYIVSNGEERGTTVHVNIYKFVMEHVHTILFDLYSVV